MKVPDLVIEASQAVFEWSARHECCLMPEVHTVQPNCEATVKARERDVPPQLLCAWLTSCSNLLQLLLVRKKANKTSMQAKVLCGSETSFQKEMAEEL